MIPPTWPRRARGLVLLTFGEANSPRRLAVVAWSPWPLMASHDVTWASPASRSSSKVSPWSPQASPWFNCFGRWWIELTRQLSSSARVWGLQDKIRQAQAAIYRASCTVADSVLVGEKSWRGESRLVMSSLRTLFRSCSDQCCWAGAGPLGRELGHAQEKVKGGWAGLAPGWAGFQPITE
jgi:hypothetical protein